MSPKLLQGNHACALGALAAGCRFFAGYPITPSSEIAEIMSRELPKVGGKFIQMEDEIASIAAVIGASVGGLKAMTATSGPGFSLMQENIGYAAVAEIPCVIVNVMRAGPSTGLPTSPSQGDVMQARWGTHGDHPIIALAPASVREAFDLTVTAFNFAEKYRTPVFVLMDEVVGHMREKVELPQFAPEDIVNREMPTVPPEWYEPFGNPPSDVPPWPPLARATATTSPACCTMPGVSHQPPGRDPALDRPRLSQDRPQPGRDLPLGSRTGSRMPGSWSSPMARRPARRARRSRSRGPAMGAKLGLLRLKTLWPFPEEVVERVAEVAQRVIVAEMNLGQIALEVERIVGPQQSGARRPRRRPDGHPRADRGRHAGRWTQATRHPTPRPAARGDER